LDGLLNQNIGESNHIHPAISIEEFGAHFLNYIMRAVPQPKTSIRPDYEVKNSCLSFKGQKSDEPITLHAYTISLHEIMDLMPVRILARH
jgi:hypothetical protein